MSFFTFNIIANAVDAYQQATNVTADNIANVSTPGASRQSATVTEAIPISGSPFYSAHLGSPGTRGEGAVVNQIARIHQDSYDGLFRGASSSQYFYTTQQQQLGTLQSNFGEPSNGINTAYAAFQSAISSASAQAGSSVADRQAVLSRAQTLATALNSASASIATQQTTVLQQASSIVMHANGFIDQIAALNGKIRSLTAVGDNPNTYLDQRDYAIDQLSQIVGTATSLQPNGSSVVSVDGRPLVTDTIAYHLAPPVIGTSPNGTPTFTIGFATDPNPSNPVPVPLASGQLGAFADVYNNKLVPYSQQLDNFASATATEVNRITQAGVDLNGNPGTPLFAIPPGQQPVSAANISVAITDPSQLPLGLLSTAAGSLTQPMNSANNTVSTTVSIDGDPTLLNPPAAPLIGKLTVTVDGTAQNFAYTTQPGGNADTITHFMSNFNAGHFGVTASYDATTQTIAFARDPNNSDVVHRGAQGAAATTAGFTISDDQGPLANSIPATQGTPATGLLQALGALQLNGVPQTPLNAYGAADNGAANALLKVFSQTVGVGALQTTAATVSGGPYSTTISPPAGNPTAFSTIVAGSNVTFVNAVTGTSQTVLVSAVNGGSITVLATAPISKNDAAVVPTTTTVGTASSTTAGPVTVTPPVSYPGAFVTVHLGDVLSIGGVNEPVTAVNRSTGSITVNASVPVNVGDAIALPATGAGLTSTSGPYTVTIAQPAGVPGAFATVNVGQVLTIVNAASGTQQNVPVTAVNRLTGTITVTASQPVNVNDPITTAQSQTLGAAYQGLVTQMGLDMQTATAGVTSQSKLAASIDQARQSVDGINIDEETQNLLKFQSAYSAAAKTLSTLNAMMQTTLGLISGG